MAVQPFILAMEQNMLGWSDLARRRRSHLVELHHSGRWKHYFATEAQLVEELNRAISTAERWGEIASRPGAARRRAILRAQDVLRSN